MLLVPEPGIFFDFSLFFGVFALPWKNWMLSQLKASKNDSNEVDMKIVGEAVN